MATDVVMVSTYEAVAVLLEEPKIWLEGNPSGLQATVLMYVAQLRRAGGLGPLHLGSQDAPARARIRVGVLDAPLSNNFRWWPPVALSDYINIRQLMQRRTNNDLLDAELGQGG